jgi:hypothetical protein
MHEDIRKGVFEMKARLGQELPWVSSVPPTAVPVASSPSI